jgi:hypothetical protein
LENLIILFFPRNEGPFLPAGFRLQASFLRNRAQEQERGQRSVGNNPFHSQLFKDNCDYHPAAEALR